MDWKDSTVVAIFDSLDLEGQSERFGDVRVHLDPNRPSMGVVTAGDCNSIVNVEISMPRLGIVLKNQQPVQLRSSVKTIPPIGDQQTSSLHAVELVDMDGRVRGSMQQARVLWRELVRQESLALK